MRLLFILLVLSSYLFSAETYLLKNDLEGTVNHRKLTSHPKIDTNTSEPFTFLTSYMLTANKDIVSGVSGYGDIFDIVLHYQTSDAYSFGAKFELQHAYGDLSSGQFYKQIGSLYKVSPSYKDIDPYIKEMWAEYHNNDLKLRLGVINTSSFVDQSFYNNYTTFYMSHATASQTYGYMPLSSLGVGFSYKKDTYYISGALSDATANLEDAMTDIRDHNLSRYRTLEFGYTPNKDIYFINIWDKKDKHNKHSYGAYLSYNHYLNEKNKIYAKYGANHNTSIRQHFSMGWSHDSLVSSKDLLLTAFSISEAADSHKIQSSIELLYKYSFDSGIEVSGDLQFIHHPLSDEKWVILPGLRIKAVF